MNLLFELFRGGIIFEVKNVQEAQIAERSGAVAILLHMNISPIHPDGDQKELHNILQEIHIPVLASFRPGHFVEAELLHEMGVWGVYADSRFEEITTSHNILPKDLMFPLLADIVIEDDILPQDLKRFIPVIRGENTEEILENLQKKQKDDFIFVAGDIETVSDIALLRRMGADTLILPNSVFDFEKPENYLQKLVQASLYFNNTEKLANILQ